MICGHPYELKVHAFNLTFFIKLFQQKASDMKIFANYSTAYV